MLLLISCHLNILAQGKIITGVILDKTGETVIGASVLVKGTTNGTITDVDGNFTLNNVQENAVLQVSFVGYKTQDIALKGQSNVKVTLEEDTEVLDEVVVIGYGSVKKSTLTGAVAKMDTKGIQDRPLARPETALQGQLAGVTVRTTTGEPGADMQIRVRGAASVNANSDPLYVVDGVPMTTLSGINPADIASIEVLKDAASAAIYGSRGSNGVVIVTTQKGKTGKPKVSFNASVGFQTLEKKIDLLSATEWMEFRTRWNDAYYLSEAQKKGITNASIRDDNATRLANVGVKAGTDNAYLYILDDRWFNYLSQDMRDSHTYTPTSESLSLLDWQDEVYRTAIVQDYSLNVSGATDNVSYLFSGGYMNQEGLATGTGYKRFSFRANVESKINKYLSIGMNLAPTYIVTDGSGRANGKDSQAHKTLSSAPVSEPGVGYMTYVQPNGRYGWADTTSSPSYILNTDISQNRTLHMVGNAFLRITPFQDFRVELSAAANYYDLDGNKYSFSSSGKGWAKGEGQSSSGSHSTSRIWNTLLQAVANYDHTFNKHGVSAMLGFSSEQSSLGYKTEQGFKAPFPNDAITGSFDGSKVAAGTNTVTEQTPNKLLSTFGRLQYNYDERYMLSGSLRFDGGSVFGVNNKWGVFPAISGGWIISNEKFFKNWDQKWWNTLKIRASYGVTGNNSISNTAAYATLTSSVYGGAAGYYTSSLGNADLGWEKTHSTDIAVDLGFLNNRIQLSLDWYTKNTTDLLYQVPVEGASGFSTIWDNLGDIHNEGFEIELNTHNLTGNFKWDTSFNMSYNKNEVKKLGTDNTPIYSGFSGSNYSNILTVGKAVNTYYMYDAIGVWKNQAEIDAYSAAHNGQPVTFEGKQIQPGDIRYRDVNNDGKYDKDNDRDYLGSPTPKFVFGMTNRFSYKNFDLSVYINGSVGNDIYNVLRAETNIVSAWGNQRAEVKDRWTVNNPNGKYPRAHVLVNQNLLQSDYLIEDGSFLRIQNVTLGYTFPKVSFLRSLRIYATAQNLLTITGYSGYNPEVNSQGQSNLQLGVDYNAYPTARSFILGVNIGF